MCPRYMQFQDAFLTSSDSEDSVGTQSQVLMKGRRDAVEMTALAFYPWVSDSTALRLSPCSNPVTVILSEVLDMTAPIFIDSFLTELSCTPFFIAKNTLRDVGAVLFS